MMQKELDLLGSVDHYKASREVNAAIPNIDSLIKIAGLVIVLIDAVGNIFSDGNVKWWQWGKIGKIIKAVYSFIVGIREVRIK